MRGLDDLFKVPNLNTESIEEEDMFNELTVILSGLANESHAGRNYTCDDVAEILMHLVNTTFSGTKIAKVLTLLCGALGVVQQSMDKSIEKELLNLADTNITPQEKRIVLAFLKEPKLYSWIRTSSV